MYNTLHTRTHTHAHTVSLTCLCFSRTLLANKGWWVCWLTKADECDWFLFQPHKSPGHGLWDGGCGQGWVGECFGASLSRQPAWPLHLRQICQATRKGHRFPHTCQRCSAVWPSWWWACFAQNCVQLEVMVFILFFSSVQSSKCELNHTLKQINTNILFYIYIYVMHLSIIKFHYIYIYHYMSSI